jgi:hypothetical protein
MRVILTLEEEEGFTRDIFDRSLGRITPLRLCERYMTSNE